MTCGLQRRRHHRSILGPPSASSPVSTIDALQADCGTEPRPNTVALLNRVYRITKVAGLNAVADSNATNFIPLHHQQERYPALIPAVVTAMHTIELIGSYTARHVESGLTVDLTSRRNRSTTKGPISPLCRKLVDLGHDPSGKVHVIRKALDRYGHIPVFQRDRTLTAWAGADCVESETRSVRIVKHRPFAGSVGAFHGR